MNKGSKVITVQGRRTAVQFIRHPLYDIPRRHNDIALVRLNKPLTRRRCIKINRDRRFPYYNTKLIQVGWGTIYRRGPIADSPGFIYGSRSFKKKDCYWNYLCVKVRGKQAVCPGDSGGPVYANNKLVGVLARGGKGRGCGQMAETMPVSRYARWIRRHIGRATRYCR